MSELDITGWKQTGKALILAISEAVDNKDNFIIQPIPSVLKLNTKQFLSLKGLNALQAMSEYSEILDIIRESKHMMFRTKKGYVLELKLGGKDGI